MMDDCISVFKTKGMSVEAGDDLHLLNIGFTCVVVKLT